MGGVRYDWLGAVFGLALPAIATCVAAWDRSGSISPAALAAAQASQPLLWLIDTAPLVLAALGRAVERQQRVVTAQQTRIARLESQRRASLDRTAVELSGTAMNLLRDVSALAAASAQMTTSVRGTIETMTALSHGATAAALAAETVAGRALDAASREDATTAALADTLRASAKSAGDIARIAQEQMDGIDRVLAAMNQIHFATETSAASTHEIASEARALARRAKDLRGVLGGDVPSVEAMAPANAAGAAANVAGAVVANAPVPAASSDSASPAAA